MPDASSTIRDILKQMAWNNVGIMEALVLAECTGKRSKEIAAVTEQNVFCVRTRLSNLTRKGLVTYDVAKRAHVRTEKGNEIAAGL